MRVSIERSDRPYRLPGIALAAGAALIGLGLTTAALSDGSGPTVCPFRLLTGIPCPTCGMVRTARLVMQGQFSPAWMMNPLDALAVMVVGPLAVVLLAANRLGAWAVRVRAGRREKVALWGLAAVLLAGNWFYVLRNGL